jgi:predicted proteasome-type protease
MNDHDKRIELEKQAYFASLNYTWDKTVKEIQETIEEYSLSKTPT